MRCFVSGFLSLSALSALFALSAHANPEVGSPENPVLKAFGGTWKGSCENVSGGVNQRRVVAQMERTVFEDAAGVIHWNSKYTSDLYPPGEKNYLLKTVDVNKGVYAIDEGNGVEIATTFTGDAFWSLFQVAVSPTKSIFLHSREQVKGRTLTVEIVSYGAPVDAQNTGVGSSSFSNVQLCTLRKIR